MKFPDKQSQKHTTTYKFREELATILKGYKDPIYLEIGCASGFTLATVAEHCKEVHGCDTEEWLIKKTNHLLEVNNIKNVCVYQGDVREVPERSYDVIFIDAMHGYNDVKKDTRRALEKQKNENKFTIVYHDYGLVAHSSRPEGFIGVKKFCDEFFKGRMTFIGEEKDWNPQARDPAETWEAAVVEIDPKEVEELIKKFG